MIFKINFITQILIVFFICSCDNMIFNNNVTSQNNKNLNGTRKQQIDSLELFFQSKGLIIFNPSDINLKKDFEILNEDNTLYATINFSLDKIIIKGQHFSLEQFANDDSLRNEYGFFPKAFFPDQTIFQFEYINLINNVAEIYINKELGKKKKIKLKGDLFKAESWKEHLIGCMIDFNCEINPIRATMHDNSNSLGYENSGENYIFVISEIVGDWIKIECADICEFPCNSGNKYDGWIKWKNSNKLLIQLLYAC